MLFKQNQEIKMLAFSIKLIKLYVSDDQTKEKRYSYPATATPFGKASFLSKYFKSDSEAAAAHILFSLNLPLVNFQLYFKSKARLYRTVVLR